MYDTVITRTESCCLRASRNDAGMVHLGERLGLEESLARQERSGFGIHHVVELGSLVSRRSTGGRNSFMRATAA